MVHIAPVHLAFSFEDLVSSLRDFVAVENLLTVVRMASISHGCHSSSLLEILGFRTPCLIAHRFISGLTFITFS